MLLILLSLCFSFFISTYISFPHILFFFASSSSFLLFFFYFFWFFFLLFFSFSISFFNSFLSFFYFFWFFFLLFFSLLLFLLLFLLILLLRIFFLFRFSFLFFFPIFFYYSFSLFFLFTAFSLFCLISHITRAVHRLIPKCVASILSRTGNSQGIYGPISKATINQSVYFSRLLPHQLNLFPTGNWAWFKCT